MNGILAMIEGIADEIRAHRVGRCALREFRFAKYKVAPQQGDRNVEERVLEGLPRRLAGGRPHPLETH